MWRSTGLVVLIGLFAILAPTRGSAQSPEESVLFQNVRVFDGKSSALSSPTNVLVRGNKIEKITAAYIAAGADVTIIDGGGRTLMPGLIDAHWHAMLVRSTPAR
jgi:imidazolonepropionase-like amidohydrolase